MTAGTLAVLFAAAALASFILNTLLLPLLKRYALAQPNARSSHKAPTPQGGGIGVVVSTIGVVVVSALFSDVDSHSLWLPLAATVFITLVGALDDMRSLPVAPRLLLQIVAIAMVLVALPFDIRIAPILPAWLERAFLAVALLWFVNLTNFMDGIDWMTVAETVPLCAGLVLFSAFGALPREAAVVALALSGAMLGFAPLNRPVARLFLGDVGSLPIGLLLGWLLITLAGRGHFAAALLLPLYYLCDATSTLLRRLAKREPVWQAHRTHFYQRATDNGHSIAQIVSRVFILNVALIALAIATLFANSYFLQTSLLLAGCSLVALLLRRFASAAS